MRGAASGQVTRGTQASDVARTLSHEHLQRHTDKKKNRNISAVAPEMNLLYSFQQNVTVSRAHKLKQNIPVCMQTIKLVRKTIRKSFTTATRVLLMSNSFNAWWIGNGRNSLVPALLMRGCAYFLCCLNRISEFWSVDQQKQDISHTQLFPLFLDDSWTKKEKKSRKLFRLISREHEPQSQPQFPLCCTSDLCCPENCSSSQHFAAAAPPSEMWEGVELA